MQNPKYQPERIVLIDIDGLCQAIWQQALEAQTIPHLASLIGGQDCNFGIQFEAVSTLPSITYCCQASAITGAHPSQHWIAGNQFFDRFGRLTGGRPRLYQFDYQDAPAVFLQGLAGAAINPEVETIYETAARHNRTSTVAFHMYAHGAQHWLKPGIEDWADFVFGEAPGFGARFDQAMINDVLEHLEMGARPDLLTVYFFGLDHESHIHGPQIQTTYLSEVIDPQIGRLLQALRKEDLLSETLFAIFSDHGQISVTNDDRHNLKVGFLIDREIGDVFQALKLDVYDHPFEGLACDVFLVPAGGMASLYIRRCEGDWSQPPQFDHDILTAAEAFWQANREGLYSTDLYQALDMILVRDVENQGWYAPYQAFTPQGLISVENYLSQHPEIEAVDTTNRLAALSSPSSGDILLFARTAEGYCFSTLPYRGSHGGLHPDESLAVLAFGMPEAAPAAIDELRKTLRTAITARCRAEGNRRSGNVDLAYGLRAVMGWNTHPQPNDGPR